MSENELTESKLKEGVVNLRYVLHYLAEGKYFKVPGLPYPLAMGVDGSVGMLYNNHIPSPMEVGVLVRELSKYSLMEVERMEYSAP